MSNKKYRLLKDLPDAKVGTIFSYTEDGYYTAETPGEDGICGKWPPHYVQSNSTWFEEVKEEPPGAVNEAVVLLRWIEHLCKYNGWEFFNGENCYGIKVDGKSVVKEFYDKDEIHGNYAAVHNLFRRLIEGSVEEAVKGLERLTAAPKEEPPARIEVGYLFPQLVDEDESPKWHRKYSFLSTDSIPPNKGEEILRAIEAVVNGEKEFVVTTDGTNDEFPKIFVSGVEYAPKGFWTDELVKDAILGFIQKYVANETFTWAHLYPHDEEFIAQFKKTKSREQSKQGAAGPSLEALEFAWKILNLIYNGTCKLEAPVELLKDVYHHEMNKISAAIRERKCAK
jgi:hypothetical protein